MSIFDIFKKPVADLKAYPAASTMYDPSGQIQFPVRSYESLAKEGYRDNAIVFRCVQAIKTAIGELEIDLYKYDGKGNRLLVESHEVIDLIAKPNPMQGKNEFIQELVGYFLIDGNAYIFNPLEESKPKSIQTLRPSDVKVIAGQTQPSAFELTEKSKRYPVDVFTGKSAVLQIKDFNPLGIWYGMSRLTAAAHSIDIFNEAQRWNYALIKSGCKPSGILSSKEFLTPEQFSEIQESISASWAGSRSNGVKLTNALEFKQMSLSPTDMDFQNNQIMAARHIAQVFGVPPQLIGLPEASTFSNVENAKLDFYENTVIPIANHVWGAINRWIFDFYENTEGYKFEVNLDKVSALDIVRKERADRYRGLVDSGIITPNEAREKLGYGDTDNKAMGKFYINGSKVPIEELSIDSELTEEEEGLAKGKNGDKQK